MFYFHSLVFIICVQAYIHPHVCMCLGISSKVIVLHFSGSTTKYHRLEVLTRIFCSRPRLAYLIAGESPVIVYRQILHHCGVLTWCSKSVPYVPLLGGGGNRHRIYYLKKKDYSVIVYYLI